MDYRCFLILGILLVGIIVPISASETGYYAYGDSITFWDNNYIEQMVATHDPTIPVSKNIDGCGEGSKWGYENLAQHYDPKYSIFIIEFGENDYIVGETAQYLIGMYNAVQANGSRPVILIPTLRTDNEGGLFDYQNQVDKLTTLMMQLDTAGIPYVKMYDAIDTVPGNGQIDVYDQRYYVDEVHPNLEGHRVMAEYLWNYLHPKSTTGSIWALDTNGSGWDGTDLVLYFGKNNDIPVVGDWDGNGITDIGAFRPSNGYWYLDTNKDGIADISYKFGKVGDIPIVGDWNGDGVTDTGVFRQQYGVWYLETGHVGVLGRILYFGKVGDVPLIGDWDNNQKDEIGVYRPVISG